MTVGARLLAAAAVLVLGLGAVAVVVILSDPYRVGRVFSGEGQPVPPAATATAAPDGTSGLGGAARAGMESLTAVESGPLAGRRSAEFELVDGVTRFHLTVVELGEELYRIGSPDDSGARPRAELSGDRLRLRMERIDELPSEVEVLLNARVSWDLRITGGTTDRRLDLAAARLTALEFAGGATRTELRLPKVDRGLVVRVTGGVNLFDVRVGGGVPVRVRAGSGAGAVQVYEQRRDGVPAGTVFGSPNWDQVAGRILLDLVAGAHIVTVRPG
ncbi:hypothetical protein [Micromonospora endophytica]|uniref:Uncharacterized protein n=1 Tax=Micromonospora endophytica TaxID=515350 RepID=A0A2W2CC79_9ACTN|nr:hypothetical protein [Micromonospora endophytica]PZF90464.1 hypothetical protein C1I93_22650 [Micromonospora endophytica]RIW48276.1 hypothetical protein D3H59_08095 [Micromonospora endophytica]BCJ56658.1 hypothetical protein Jiend_00800 [Micromonospora endophytica]